MNTSANVEDQMVAFLMFSCFPRFPWDKENTYPGDPFHDYDQDGYTEQEGDCNDRDLNIVKGPWYKDADQDGYGDSEVFTSDCDLVFTESYVSNDLDCNDADNSIFPGSARFEPNLCAVDSDGDGYADAAPTVPADVGTDCNDNDATVYPGRNDEPGVLCVLDQDADGYGDADAPLPYDAGSDCNDSNEFINPSVYEICDEQDNDCDGEIDEIGALSAPLWYVDSDGDGYGSIAALPLELCSLSPPTGYAGIGLDCNDTDANIYPGNIEVCDGIDNNCDGTADEAVQVAFYEDSDEDGYGDPTRFIMSCAAPSGYVDVVNAQGDQLFDCDPTDPLQYPGADEYCNLEDDNCDGVVDEDSAIDTIQWYFDGDDDGFGTLSGILNSCFQPNGYVNVEDAQGDQRLDCDDADPSEYPGAPELCDGEDDDCDGTPDNDPIGQLTFYLDLDGDGDGDSTDLDGDDLPDNVLVACPIFNPLPSAPVGYAETAGDCNDQVPTINSFEDEKCSIDIDENCDGYYTLGATDAVLWYADNDNDGFGNESYTIYSCPVIDSNGVPQPPQGYVALSTDPLQQVFDCDDTDGTLFPNNTELCNGKLDDCNQGEDLDGDGVLDSSRAVERDDDGDRYIECDYTQEIWLNSADIPIGWGDCQDDDPDVFPGAPELCSGEIEDCDDPAYPSTPADESDEDGDGYVECTGFSIQLWEGASSVVGGGDCNDSDEDINQDGIFDGRYIFPNSAENLADPTFCSADSPEPGFPEGDGDPDCVRWSSNLQQVAPVDYYCDYGVFLTDPTIGPDFILIPAGNDPAGRYSLSNSFYIMTTEVTQAMYLELKGGANPSEYVALEGPIETISWYLAAEFANLLSEYENRDKCYNPLDDFEPYSQYSAEAIYTCPGYRLPTEAEWEFAARSGLQDASPDFTDPGKIWTPNGGGPILGASCATNTIDDGGLLGPFQLSQFAWYCGNNTPNSTKEVAQLKPNGFGLYDMYGNVEEWTTDWSSANYVWYHTFPNGASDMGTGLIPNPIGSGVGSGKITRGGGYYDYPNEIGVSKISLLDPSNEVSEVGFRLVRTAP